MRSLIISDYGTTVAGYGGELTIRLSWDLPLTMVIEVCKDWQTIENITLADLKAFIRQREVDAERFTAKELDALADAEKAGR